MKWQLQIIQWKLHTDDFYSGVGSIEPVKAAKE